MPGELARAICSVMGQCRTVPETGYNQHGRYNYASDADLLAVVQPAMVAAGLALIPRSVRTATVQHGESKSGNAKWRTDLVVTYALIHVSGEEQVVEVAGCGIDNEDKGAFKATTGALKYALRQLFLIPTGLDPERVDRRDDRDDNRGRDDRPRRDDRDDRGSRSQRDDRGDRDERPSDPPREEPAREWDPAVWTAELGRFGLDLDEVCYYLVEVDERGTHPADLEPSALKRCLAWLISAEGSVAVETAAELVRGKLQRAFFPKWEVEFPTPRKKDGVSDEDRARAEATSEANRRIVFEQWYGAKHLADLPIRTILQGEHGLPWLSRVTPSDFAVAVDEALGKAQDGGQDTGAGREQRPEQRPERANETNTWGQAPPDDIIPF